MEHNNLSSYKISETWIVRSEATLTAEVYPEDFIECTSDSEVWDELYDELYSSGEWDNPNILDTIDPVDGFEIDPEFFKEVKRLRKENGETEYVD